MHANDSDASGKGHGLGSGPRAQSGDKESTIGSIWSMSRLEQLVDIPARAMAVAAHPDDAELNAGGTLARWIAAGCEVTLVVCSNGEAGSSDPEMTCVEVARIRRTEQASAVKLLGVRELVRLGLPDGGLEDSADFRGRLVELIRRHRPETVITHDPHLLRAFSHRDHRIVATVVQDSIFPFARDRLHFPEQIQAGLEPHKVGELLFWESEAPNTIVDVSGHLETQAEALGQHRSQLAGLACGSDPAGWLLERSRATAAGEAFENGEAFRRLIAPP